MVVIITCFGTDAIKPELAVPHKLKPTYLNLRKSVGWVRNWTVMCCNKKFDVASNSNINLSK